MATAHQKPSNPRFQDLTGQRFGRLIVIEYRGLQRGNARWFCRCECGNEIVTGRSNLTSGNTKSCGCLQRQLATEKFTRHGATGTTLHNRWLAMIQRCTNPKSAPYPRYGGRGITVCERWMTFENFVLDMGVMPSADHEIERRDNNRGYEPGNCYWATVTAQARNRSNNVLIEHDGRTMTLVEYAASIGLPYKRVHHWWKVGKIPNAFRRGDRLTACDSER